MTALMNETVRIIDFSENETGIIRKLDNLKMRYATVINLHCLNKFKTFTNLFNQFRDLIENAKVFKILYSEIEDDVKNLPASIDWQSRKDTIYAGEKLEFSNNIIRRYWEWKLSSEPPRKLLGLKSGRI